MELTVFLNEINCDIFCVTEHWSKAEQIKSVSINGYYIPHFFCRTNYKNGGVGFYIKDNIRSETLQKINELTVEKDFECSCIKFYISKDKFIILLGVYRSPSGSLTNFLKKLTEALDLLTNKNKAKNIIVCGDFNINFLVPAECRKLVDILDSFNITPVIQQPTRMRNCLDNICVNKTSTDFSSAVLYNGHSDHMAQQLILKINEPEKETQVYKFRDLNNKKNIEQFCNLLKKEKWNEIIHSSHNVDKKFNIFLDIFLYYMDICFPEKTKKTKKIPGKPHNNWMTRGLKISAQNLKNLHRKVALGDTTVREYHKKYKSIYNKLLKAAKLQHNNKLLLNAENKSKTIWQILRTKNSSTKTIQLKREDKIENDSLIVSSMFNDHFNKIPREVEATINKKDNIKPGNNNNIPHNNSTIFIQPATEVDVISIIKNLKNSNSLGPDGVHVNLLKKCYNQIILPITHLLNCSITEGNFPSKLKIAKIVPIHKSKEETDINNYRPIAILSAFSKIFEKYIANSITQFLDKHDLLNSSQYGFRKGISSAEAINNLLDNVYSNLDKNKKTIGVFLDLSKAFDVINHSMLLDKLERYGIRGVALKWMTSYLTNRKHYVALQGKKSKLLTTSVGVPQGSIMGPLLFIIFINDLKTSDLTIFADDTSFLTYDKELAISINKCNLQMKHVEQWFNKNKLLLNMDKSLFLHFTPTGNQDKSLLIKSDSGSIHQQQTTKFLGIHFQENCKWEVHVSYLCKKVAVVCYCIKQLKSVVSLSVLKIYYFAYFHAVISYNIIAWGSSPETQRLFLLQKRALRYMFGLSSHETCKPYFTKYDILTIPSIFIYNLLIYVKKNINQFKRLTDTHDYDTRGDNILEIPAHKHKKYENSPRYLAIKAYNKLPNNIKILSMPLYKKKIKKILVKKAYYKIAEYFDTNLTICV